MQDDEAIFAHKLWTLDPVLLPVEAALINFTAKAEKFIDALDKFVNLDGDILVVQKCHA